MKEHKTLFFGIICALLVLLAASCTTTKNTSKTTTKETTTDDITSVTTSTTTEIAQGTIATVADTLTATRSMTDLFDGDSLVKETGTLELVTKIDKKGNITTRAIAKPQTLHYNINKVTIAQTAQKEHKTAKIAVTEKKKDVQRETGLKTINLCIIFGMMALILCFYLVPFFRKKKQDNL